MWRADTAISASCSMVVPNSYMCLRATMAYLAMRVWPHGASNWDGPLELKARLAPRSRRLRSALVVEPYESTTTSASPSAMAAMACSAMNSHELPPTWVESAHVGRRPRYSVTSTGASVPVPQDM